MIMQGERNRSPLQHPQFPRSYCWSLCLNKFVNKDVSQVPRTGDSWIRLEVLPAAVLTWRKSTTPFLQIEGPSSCGPRWWDDRGCVVVVVVVLPLGKIWTSSNHYNRC